MLVAATDFASYLIRSGELAGGSAAIGGSVGLVIGAIAEDLRVGVDRWKLAEKGAALGVLFGVCFGLFAQS